jgi:murein DD-endopeptidase MepM/ murein hydrolase activator NlpD
VCWCNKTARVGQTLTGATDNKHMKHQQNAQRRLFVPALALISAALMTLGARYPAAVASCVRQPSDADVVSLAPVAQPKAESAGGDPCPSNQQALAPAADPSNAAPLFDLSKALEAALGPAGLSAAPPAPPTVSSSGTSPLRGAFSPPATSASGFIWPIIGPITQAFGVPELGVGLPHTGLDIGKDSGSPIRAAQAGRVIFAGGDPCCGLGYWIEINHGNRYATRYGHMMRPPLLLVGDYVTQGQIIGFSGNTGFSTGPHLHLEFRRDGVPIDPLTMLPRQ